MQQLTSGALVDITNGNSIWLDGAHNAHGAQALLEAMSAMNKYDQWSIVVGALNTRPIEDFLSQIKPIAKQIIAITIPEQDAALDAIESNKLQKTLV